MENGNRTFPDEMTKAYIKANAWSFPPGQPPPNHAELLFAEQRADGDICRYYGDSEGNYWFDSVRLAAFDKEMKKAQRRRRERYAARYR